jgi:RNA polymerase sigma factor (sigma-70 family)
MKDSPELRIRDAQDNQAWSEFVDIYAPLIHGFARKHGLQDADAANLTQEVLLIVARKAKSYEYDAEGGSFRGWLFTVVHNKMLNLIASQNQQPQGTGDTAVQGLLDRKLAPVENPIALWEQDHKRQLFIFAGKKVRKKVKDTTWQAFQLTAVDGKKPEEVAGMLGRLLAGIGPRTGVLGYFPPCIWNCQNKTTPSGDSGEP